MKDECEWCHTSSPVINNNHYGDYREIHLFLDKHHVICEDCYKHLKKVK